MTLLPGFDSIFGAPKQPERAPVVLSEAKPIEADRSAEIEAARRKQLEAEKRRRGRAATLVTGGRGAVEDPLGGGGTMVERPRARSALTFG